MKKLRPDSTVMKVTDDHELISHEKAYVKMESGCVWVYLLDGEDRVGIAFAGPARFAVDAIAETKMGAMGESVTGSLEGIQLYIGPVSLENISESTDTESLQSQGFQDSQSFIDEVDSTIADQFNGDHSKTKIDLKEDSHIFFGYDSEKTKLLLVMSKNKLVFTYGKQVFVVEEDKMVSVSKSGVVVTNEDGKQIVIGKGGIHGIDSFLDIGPIVTESVTEAMKDLKGLKSLKSLKKSMKGFPYDNVDDFDWDD